MSVRWDGVLRAFDDPERKAGEPWVAPTSPQFHERIERELSELRGEKYVLAAIACQGLARAYATERNEHIAQAVAAGANVADLAAQLGLSRQQIYAIAKSHR